MSLRIGNRSFAPRAWAVVLTAALLAAFVSAGWWQVGVLRLNHASWDDPPAGDICAFVDDDLRSKRNAVLSEFAALGRPWMFKDPRTLLTLPFWREAVPHTYRIGIFRHPIRVALSFYYRSQMPIVKGLALWLAYNRALATEHERSPFPLLCFDLPPAEFLNSAVAVVQQECGPLVERGLLDLAKMRSLYAPELVHQNAGDPGEVRQHAKHLPLGTDIYGALETCLLVAQKSEAVVAPVVLAGLSSHHLGFPGTITLTPETFEAVVYEAALSLVRHGFRKVLLYNGHGGNTESVAKIIYKINQTTPATAIDMERVYIPPKEPLYPPISIDVHAGVSETSWALYLFGSLVDLSKVENPVLTFPPAVRQFMEKAKTDSVFAAVWGSMWFRPLETGKKTSTREMTNTGAVTNGDIKTATSLLDGQKV